MGQDIIRRQDWPMSLSEYLTTAAHRSFRWGTNDCVMHCANAVRAMTGVDIMKEHRGQYRSRKAAYAIVHRCFDKDTDNIFNRPFGKPHRNILAARRGDVCRGIKDDGEKVYGVVDDSGRQVALLTEVGLTRYPLDWFSCYWRVG